MRITSPEIVADSPQLASVIRGDRLVGSVPKVVPQVAAIDLAKFGLLLIEVIGLACVVKRFQIESAAFFEIMVFATVGFAIQYFLPLARAGRLLLVSVVGEYRQRARPGFRSVPSGDRADVDRDRPSAHCTQRPRVLPVRCLRRIELFAIRLDRPANFLSDLAGAGLDVHVPTDGLCVRLETRPG